MNAPTNIPAKGFYYHYKHDPKGSARNYAYWVLGAGSHTEEEDTFMVVYQPLYEEASVWKAGQLFDLRPLAMFMSDVTKDGKTFPRFQRIRNPFIIAYLMWIRWDMYRMIG
jgi:hypothetical protein